MSLRLHLELVKNEFSAIVLMKDIDSQFFSTYSKLYRILHAIKLAKEMKTIFPSNASDSCQVVYQAGNNNCIVRNSPN